MSSKVYRRGTHRSSSPEETLAALQPYLAVAGITRVANVTGLDRIGIPVVMVCRPNARSLAVYQGKGFDLASAKVSGVMEAIEHYHAERIRHPLRLASEHDLRDDEALVDVAGLPRPRHGMFHADLPLLWIAGEDLMRQTRVWVPYELVHMNYTLPLPPGHGSFMASSNGLASGNNLSEAISHAICELIERDATALWFLRGGPDESSSRIDPNTIDDSDCRLILDRYAHVGIEVGVWNVTSDIGIAVFVCMIMEETVNPLRRVPSAFGSGCHPAREVAMLRALTEAAQSRLTLIAGSRDDLPRADYERLRAGEGESRFPRVAEPPCRFRDAPTHDHDTLDADVSWELACLRAAGLEQVVVIDLTRPDIGMAVVRVVVPGLEVWLHGAPVAPGRRARAVLETRT